MDYTRVRWRNLPPAGPEIDSAEGWLYIVAPAIMLVTFVSIYHCVTALSLAKVVLTSFTALAARGPRLVKACGALVRAAHDEGCRLLTTDQVMAGTHPAGAAGDEAAALACAPG